MKNISHESESVWRALIISALQHGAHTPLELSAATGLTLEQLRVALIALVDEGVVGRRAVGASV